MTTNSEYDISFGSYSNNTTKKSVVDVAFTHMAPVSIVTTNSCFTTDVALKRKRRALVRGVCFRRSLQEIVPNSAKNSTNEEMISEMNRDLKGYTGIGEVHLYLGYDHLCQVIRELWKDDYCISMTYAHVLLLVCQGKQFHGESLLLKAFFHTKLFRIFEATVLQ